MCYCGNAPPRGCTVCFSAYQPRQRSLSIFPRRILLCSSFPTGTIRRSDPVSAAVTIVEYADFECPACRESVAVLKQLRNLYPEQVRLVHRDFPLPAHPGGQPAAAAAHCAYEQGEFWAYHDALFSQLPMPVEYLQLANDLKLDTRSVSAPACRAAVRKRRYRKTFRTPGGWGSAVRRHFSSMVAT